MNRHPIVAARPLIALCPSRLMLPGLALCALLAVGCADRSKTDPATGEVYEQHPATHAVTPTDAALARSKEPIASDAVVLHVNGLGCPLCASNIDKQLERVKGVSSVAVDLSTGIVTLGLAPGQTHPSPARLGDAVEDAGFTLVKVETR